MVIKENMSGNKNQIDKLNFDPLIPDSYFI